MMRNRVWVPVIRFTSCDLRLLMDQPTELISPRDPSQPARRQLIRQARAALSAQGAVRAMPVVLVGVLGQQGPQLPAAQDQQPVQQLPPNGCAEDPSDGDDHLAARVAPFQIPEHLGRLNQWVGSVDDGVSLPASISSPMVRRSS
jgi:hypothetical protein